MGEYPPAGRDGLPGQFGRVQDTSSHSQAKTGFAAMRDGTRLAYALQGAGTNGAVLVHSLAMDGAFWQPVAERLAGHMPVLTYDCRGHGASGKPAGPYTVELFARDLADLLD